MTARASTSEPGLLVVDAGNTRIKAGLAVVDRAARALPVLEQFVAVPSGDVLPWRQWDPPRRAIVTGSHPGEVARLCGEWPADWPQPTVVRSRTSLPLNIDVDFPDKVGIDRLLTAVAANVIRGEGRPVILIDSGTATTVDYVDAAGRFCGGAILPGFDLCARALNAYTALLPLIDMSDVLERDAPPAEIGRNTQAAISSGLYWGHVGAVKELLQRLLREAKQREGGDAGQGESNANHPALVLLTGGAAPLLSPHLPAGVRYEPHLALQGLALCGSVDRTEP